MSDLAPADIAARVVAWHNRHPFARRLRLADVHSVGHVALPFHDPAAAPAEPPPAAGGSLRERAMARAREAPAPAAAAVAGPLRPAFRDDFIPPLSPGEVADFAARHGIVRNTEPGGAPVRRVVPTLGEGGLAWRWVWTAELRTDEARTRVLVGPAPGAPVLGRRLWSLPRVGALAAFGGAALALALAAGLFDDSGPVPVAALPAPAGPAQPAPAAAGPAASVAMAGPGPTSAPQSASPSSADPADPAASRPLDVEPTLGRVELPPIGGIADARRRQAAQAAASAASSTPTPDAAVAATPAASAPVFALATRLLRTRTESQQIAEALNALLVVPGSPVRKVEVLRVGDDFRVVAWPYPDRAAAERAQAALQARGHRLQLIDF